MSLLIIINIYKRRLIIYKNVKEYYLVCKSCNGYYKLEENESPDLFDNCQCGGDLILVTDIDEYFEDSYHNQFEPVNKNNRRKASIFFLIALIILIPSFIFLNGTLFSDIPKTLNNHTLIGSDTRGYVTKDVYAGSTALVGNSKAIAIVTGIHPRESLSKNVTNELISKYPLKSNMKIVHYDIDVTNNPDNYNVGRTNGVGLAVDYIIPDILKSNCDLVIICHNHKQGYGQGFYIATPEMDEKSVKLGEMVNQSIPGFNYYKADNIKEHTNSATLFSKPLASAGCATFVYEIPEWVSYEEAYNTSRNFIDKCFNFIY